ncbi:right-handed parallel beta-helix repeat-containing protein [Pseudomonas sp.]|uniref:right-handed parallel beta-helix repeat-containing protein n=1 Tax=Pseudomonas sp. TaxID=306 RepID=UPI003CC6B87C
MRVSPVLAALLLALPVVTAHADEATPPPDAPQTLAVTSYADDGKDGTLRWAIEQNNQNPGHYRIEIQAVGSAPFVIKPASALPDIKGPVVIEGTAWKHTGDFIAIDGSAYVQGDTAKACPGAVAGQSGANVRTLSNPGLTVRDTQGVDISGLEVRNFCIGILLNRASNSVVHDNRVLNNRGGAGIMLSGDDGQGNATANTTNNNRILRNQLIDNGDGLELTRGAAFNLLADNLFRANKLTPEASQGVEIMQASDNTLSHNRFEGYSDGVQINGGDRNYLGGNVLSGNSIGISVTGADNLLDGNLIHSNRIGIALRPEAVSHNTRITANRIWDNSQDVKRCQSGGACIPTQRSGAIVIGVPGPDNATFVGNRGTGVEAGKAVVCAAKGPAVADCQQLPNHNQPTPKLRAIAAGRLHGEVTGEPNARYRVEVFGNAKPTETEAANFLGEVYVSTNGRGVANFSFPLDVKEANRSFTVTATSPDGATSELSKALPR